MKRLAMLLCLVSCGAPVMSNPLNDLADGIANWLDPVAVADDGSGGMKPLPASSDPLPGEPTPQSINQNYGKAIAVDPTIGTITQILSQAFAAPKAITVDVSVPGGLFNAAGSLVITVGVGSAKRTYYTDFTAGGLSFSVVCDTIEVAVWNRFGYSGMLAQASWGEGAVSRQPTQQATFTTGGTSVAGLGTLTTRFDGRSLPGSVVNGALILPLGTIAYQVFTDYSAAGYVVNGAPASTQVVGGGPSPVIKVTGAYTSILVTNSDAAAHTFSIVCYMNL
jgi:hypothetical protein